MAFVKEVMAALVWKGDFIRIRTADHAQHSVLVKSVVLSSEYQVDVDVMFLDGSSHVLQWRKIDILNVYLSKPASWAFKDLTKISKEL